MKLIFKSKFQISKNPLKIDILNYKKKDKFRFRIKFKRKNFLKKNYYLMKFL